MFITSFAAGPLQANTYVFAPHEGAGCAVVDPGMESFDPLKVVLEQHQLTVEAVLITHGHFDHMWSAQHVADHYGCPVWIHPKDRHLLTDPLAAVSGPSAAMLREQFLSFVPSFSEPAEVRDATAGVHIDVAGIDVRVHEASGHTPGTVVYMVDWDGPEPVSQVMFAGDFLFYGSIGRTDLTGGDHSQMMESLRREVLSLADDVVVLPGHGQQTSIGREKLTNPYLAELNA